MVNGQLMAIGGFDGTTYLKTIEVYDPEQNCWKLYGGMNYRRLGTCGNRERKREGGRNRGVHPEQNCWKLYGGMNYRRLGTYSSVCERG